jgi:hypothetical protein
VLFDYKITAAVTAALTALATPSDAEIEAIAVALIIADDTGNPVGILQATTHRGDCPFVPTPAAFTCARRQGLHIAI